MAKPKSENPRKNVHIRLQPEILARLELEIYQLNFTGKGLYGQRNEFIEKALVHYFSVLDQNRKDREEIENA